MIEIKCALLSKRQTTSRRSSFPRDHSSVMLSDYMYTICEKGIHPLIYPDYFYIYIGSMIFFQNTSIFYSCIPCIMFIHINMYRYFQKYQQKCFFFISKGRERAALIQFDANINVKRHLSKVHISFLMKKKGESRVCICMFVRAFCYWVINTEKTGIYRFWFSYNPSRTCWRFD